MEGNSVNNEQKNSSNKAIIIVLVLIIIGLLGFIVYDKFLQKDTKPETNMQEKECNCPKCEESKENENSSTSSDFGEKITSLKKITITEKNQTIKIGKKEYNVRRDNEYNLLINDNYIYKDGIEIGIDANENGHLYLTDKFMFLTNPAQMEEYLEYAIDENGKIDIINDNFLQMKDFKIVNSYLHASGCFAKTDEKALELYCEYSDVIIKYADNKLIVTPFK